MANPYGGQRDVEPPPGFEVWRADELDPEQGRADRWVYLGTIGGRRFVRADLPSRTTACRSAWLVFDAHWPHRADRPNMCDAYTVRLDSWDHMKASLLSQILRDAGSIRKAAGVLGVPRSTLGAWIKTAKREGAWPR